MKPSATSSPALPVPSEGAGDVAKATTGIAAAIASVWFPAAGIAAPLATLLVDKWVKRPQRILLEQLKSGKVEYLNDEQYSEFVPMGYRFFEAAKQGEYEHTLQILGEFICSELKTGTPSASEFLAMARRIEALSESELKCISLVHYFVSGRIRVSPFIREAESPEQWINSGTLFLASRSLRGRELESTQIRDALSSLAGRGLLVPDGGSKFDKSEEEYRCTSAFKELLQKARRSVAGASS